MKREIIFLMNRLGIEHYFFFPFFLLDLNGKENLVSFFLVLTSLSTSRSTPSKFRVQLLKNIWVNNYLQRTMLSNDHNSKSVSWAQRLLQRQNILRVRSYQLIKKYRRPHKVKQQLFTYSQQLIQGGKTMLHDRKNFWDTPLRKLNMRNSCSNINFYILWINFEARK